MRLSLLAEVTFVLATQLGSEEKLQTMPRFFRKPPGAVLCTQAQIWTTPAPPPRAPEHTRHCRKRSSQLRSWTLKWLLQTLPASALLAMIPGTEGSVCRLWGNLKMVPK